MANHTLAFITRGSYLHSVNTEKKWFSVLESGDLTRPQCASFPICIATL